jgi:hypothetical protein
MWVIYHKKDRNIVGLSAECEPDLERDYALEEVVKGLIKREAVNKYDAVQVSDRAQAIALLTAPRELLVLRETPKGKLYVAIEEPKLSFLLLSCDAQDVHPVDGIPEIHADGESFTTITVQKIDDHGEPQQGNKDNDLLYLRADYGALFSDDGKEGIGSIKLKKGQAAFRLVSETARRVATVQVFNADPNLVDRNIRIEFI